MKNVFKNDFMRLPGGRILAAPSWVFQGGIAENCAFLAGKVQEAGLLCYDSVSSLAYGLAELPPELSKLPLSWHAHLPLDLNWAQKDAALSTCLALMDKLAFLNVKRAVLHPPQPAEKEKDITGLLESFVKGWQERGRSPGDLLLENLPETGTAQTASAALNLGCSLCFDLAHHIMHCRKHEKKNTALWRNIPAHMQSLVRLVHLCAPGPVSSRGHHRALDALTGEETAFSADICRSFGKNTVFMLELFNWKDYTASFSTLEGWLNQAA